MADLMDRSPDRAVLNTIQATASGVPEVKWIEKILARKAGMGYFVAIHVQADPAMSLHDAHILGGKVKTAICHALPNVLGVLVHMEPFEGNGPPA